MGADSIGYQSLTSCAKNKLGEALKVWEAKQRAPDADRVKKLIQDLN